MDATYGRKFYNPCGLRFGRRAADRKTRIRSTNTKSSGLPEPVHGWKKKIIFTSRSKITGYPSRGPPPNFELEFEKKDGESRSPFFFHDYAFLSISSSFLVFFRATTREGSFEFVTRLSYVIREGMRAKNLARGNQSSKRPPSSSTTILSRFLTKPIGQSSFVDSNEVVFSSRNRRDDDEGIPLSHRGGSRPLFTTVLLILSRSMAASYS